MFRSYSLYMTNTTKKEQDIAARALLRCQIAERTGRSAFCPAVKREAAKALREMLAQR